MSAKCLNMATFSPSVYAIHLSGAFLALKSKENQVLTWPISLMWFFFSFGDTAIRVQQTKTLDRRSYCLFYQAQGLELARFLPDGLDAKCIDELPPEETVPSLDAVGSCVVA